MKKLFLFTILLFNFIVLAEDSEIGFGDSVHITMKEDEEVKFEGEVSTSGFVILPYLGAIKLDGLTEKSAEKKIKEALEKDLYQKATISLVIVKRAVGHVYLYGALKNPGKVEIPHEGKISALQAIAEANGMSKWANPQLAFLLIKNTKTNSYVRKEIDLAKAYKDISGKHNVILKKDDIIVIPTLAGGEVNPSTIQVMVAGKVEKPGVVLFEPGEYPTLVRAILKAGNFNKFANKSKVRIIRKLKNETKVIRVDVKKLLDEGQLSNDVKLLSGDLIVVDESWF